MKLLGVQVTKAEAALGLARPGTCTLRQVRQRIDALPVERLDLLHDLRRLGVGFGLPVVVSKLLGVGALQPARRKPATAAVVPSPDGLVALGDLGLALVDGGDPVGPPARPRRASPSPWASWQSWSSLLLASVDGLDGTGIRSG